MTWSCYRKRTAVALAAGVLAVLCASVAQAALRTNEDAPAVALRTVDGREFVLSDVVGPNSRDKVQGVVLSFFATWCTACVDELPMLNALAADGKYGRITVVLVDLKEDPAAVRAFLARLKIDRPVILTDVDGKAAEKYQVRFLPTTFFIGADGRIRDLLFGGINTMAELHTSADKLLR
jgi:thiol-disulfide isomerase/thioredoxin